MLGDRVTNSFAFIIADMSLGIHASFIILACICTNVLYYKNKIKLIYKAIKTRKTEHLNKHMSQKRWVHIINDIQKEF